MQLRLHVCQPPEQQRAFRLRTGLCSTTTQPPLAASGLKSSANSRRLTCSYASTSAGPLSSCELFACMQTEFVVRCHTALY